MWTWWVKIPTEDFSDVTLAIDYTHLDDVWGGDWGAIHWGWQGGRWGSQNGSWQGGWHLLKTWVTWLWRLVILSDMMLEVADKVDQVKFPFHSDKMSQKSLGSVWSCLSTCVSDGRSRTNVTYRAVQDSNKMHILEQTHFEPIWQFSVQGGEPNGEGITTRTFEINIC